MSGSNLVVRARNRYRQTCSVLFGRRLVDVRPDSPIISFSFDDFPRSALHTGGEILRKAGFHGTYYVSLGLMQRELLCGPGFSLEDLKQAVAEGHELGCHTYSHCHSWETRPEAFEEAILENGRRLEQLVPGAVFKTSSYPISCPRPENKRLAGRHFLCSRGGGRVFNFMENQRCRTRAHNLGPSDANSLQTYFLEKSGEDPGVVKRLVDANYQARGWLIFATHDIGARPSKLGCTTRLFEQIVEYAAASGSRVLPILRAWELISKSRNNGQSERSLDNGECHNRGQGIS